MRGNSAEKSHPARCMKTPRGTAFRAAALAFLAYPPAAVRRASCYRAVSYPSMTRTAVLLSLLVVGARSAPVAPGLHHAAGGSNGMDDAVAATLRTQDFIHIPGPNPILTVGANGTWDANVIECAGGVYAEYDSTPPVAQRCLCLSEPRDTPDPWLLLAAAGPDTRPPACACRPCLSAVWLALAYYLIYHGIGNDNCPPPGCLPGHHGYQVGGATAKHPLGPWTKLPENPLLQPGALSAWDGGEVASSNIVKMGENNWTMWYEATPGTEYKGKETASEWSVGIAHAKSPRGPWVKSAANPVINETIVGFDGFYVAAVMVVNGSIWMYAEVIVANDYGAKKPLKPFCGIFMLKKLDQFTKTGSGQNTEKVNLTRWSPQARSSSSPPIPPKVLIPTAARSWSAADRAPGTTRNTRRARWSTARGSSTCSSRLAVPRPPAVGVSETPGRLPGTFFLRIFSSAPALHRLYYDRLAMLTINYCPIIDWRV